MSNETLFTIGHSNRSIDDFVKLLRMFDVSAVADVRSQPYSRHMPHFNHEQLKEILRDSGIAYVFMGEELGARRTESYCYVDGQARYELIEPTPRFQAGLQRIRKGVNTHRIALMCAEKDPVTCHRAILIAKALRTEFDIRHIVAPDEVETHAQAERRLLRLWRLDERDLFQDASELLEDAYQRQGEQIAYVQKDVASAQHVNEEDD